MWICQWLFHALVTIREQFLGIFLYVSTSRTIGGVPAPLLPGPTKCSAQPCQLIVPRVTQTSQPALTSVSVKVVGTISCWVRKGSGRIKPRWRWCWRVGFMAMSLIITNACFGVIPNIPSDDISFMMGAARKSSRTFPPPLTLPWPSMPCTPLHTT